MGGKAQRTLFYHSNSILIFGQEPLTANFFPGALRANGATLHCGETRCSAICVEDGGWVILLSPGISPKAAGDNNTISAGIECCLVVFSLLPDTEMWVWGDAIICVRVTHFLEDRIRSVLHHHTFHHHCKLSSGTRNCVYCLCIHLGIHTLILTTVTVYRFPVHRYTIYLIK